MSELLILQRPGFRLLHDPVTGYTVTRYEDGLSSGCGVVPGNRYHGEKLGITPERHRLVHELLHHLVALRILKEERGSCVIWRDAHGEFGNTPEVKPGWNENHREEWYVTALTYRLWGKPVPDPGALADIRAAGADPEAICEEARELMAKVGLD